MIIHKHKIWFILNCLLFISIGFNLSLFYIPILLLHFLFFILNGFKIKINKGYFYGFILMFISLGLTYFIGGDSMKNENKEIVFIILLLFISYAGYFLQLSDIRETLILLSSFVFGLWLKSMIIVISSYSLDSAIYGYGKLYDPLSNIEINSPAISNSLSLCAVFSLFLLTLVKNRFFYKNMLLLAIVLTIFSGVYLGGRTFFLIIAFGCFFIFWEKKSIYIFIKYTLLFVVLFFVLGHYYDFSEKIAFMTERFDNGLSSHRFEHYISALKSIPYYPLGGFKIDRTIENTYWLHNFLLDVARTSGWLPFFTFIMYFTFVFILYFSAKVKYMENKIGMFMYILTIVVMMQDVILEGNYQMVILCYFSGVLATKYKLIANNNDI